MSQSSFLLKWGKYKIRTPNKRGLESKNPPKTRSFIKPARKNQPFGITKKDVGPLKHYTSDLKINTQLYKNLNSFVKFVNLKKSKSNVFQNWLSLLFIQKVDILLNKVFT